MIGASNSQCIGDPSSIGCAPHSVWTEVFGVHGELPIFQR